MVHKRRGRGYNNIGNTLWSSSSEPLAPKSHSGGAVLWSSSSEPAATMPPKQGGGATYERLGAGAIAAELGGLANGVGGEASSRQIL